MNQNKFVYIRTFGCQQNEADSETILGICETHGFLPTDDPEEADLILFNTCAVREHAELKALSTTGQLKHLKERKKDLKIGLCGCMVQQEHRKEDIRQKYPYVDFCFGTNMISRLGAILDEVFSGGGRRFYVEDYAVNPGDTGEGLPVSRKYPYKAYLSVMYGCNNFCSYCIVPYVRGRERSREPDRILEEAKGLVKAGCREITLLGQNVNSYGKDLKNPVSFAELLGRICRIPGDFVVKFMTSHPKDATPELFDRMTDPKMERHFHLPVQSGSDRILKKMNRHYTAAHFLSLCDELRRRVPEISITTDIIVGFPGETEEDFQQTLELMERCRFDGVFSFIYSPRRGTPAADLPGRLPEEVLKDRMARLLDLQMKIASENNARLVGQTLRALCEGESKTDPRFYSARTDAGKLIHFPKPEGQDPTGEFVRLTVKVAKAIMLTGELAP